MDVAVEGCEIEVLLALHGQPFRVHEPPFKLCGLHPYLKAFQGRLCWAVKLASIQDWRQLLVPAERALWGSGHLVLQTFGVRGRFHHFLVFVANDKLPDDHALETWVWGGETA